MWFCITSLLRTKGRRQIYLKVNTHTHTRMCSFFVGSPYDSKIIKIAASPLSAERFLKGKNHTGYVVPVPDWPKDAVPEPRENYA